MGQRKSQCYYQISCLFFNSKDGNIKIRLIYITIFITFLCTYAQRVSVQNTIFHIDNKEFFINGANTPWISWDEFGSGYYSSNQWEIALQNLADAKINSTRVWITCSGTVGINIETNGYVYGPTQQFWNDVDSLMSIAQSKQIYLMIALTSFDNIHGAKWEAWRAMYKTESGRMSFVQNYVKPFIERYKDNPYCFAVEVANEIEWVFEHTEVNRDQVQDLIALAANAVHANSQILIYQGTGAGPKYLSSQFWESDLFGDTALSSFQPDAYLDFYNLHHYDWMSEYWSTPYESTPSDYYIDSKPCVLGEFPAKGSDGYTILECYQNLYSNGWKGIMPWTSNGVDTNGSLNDMQSGAEWIFNNFPQYVYPIDIDKDNIPNDYEMKYSVSYTGLVANLDNDNDGFNNYEEWIALTNPNDSNSFFQIKGINSSTNGVKITWATTTNRLYSILGLYELGETYYEITNNIHSPTNSFVLKNSDNMPRYFKLKIRKE